MFAFSIYDATLFTQNGTFSWDKPFLLKIHYLRNISGTTIAKHTIQQIYEQHPMDVNDNFKEYSKVFNKLIPKCCTVYHNKTSISFSHV